MLSAAVWKTIRFVLFVMLREIDGFDEGPSDWMLSAGLLTMLVVGVALKTPALRNTSVVAFVSPAVRLSLAEL